jgi:hypothetical protein
LTFTLHSFLTKTAIIFRITIITMNVETLLGRIQRMKSMASKPQPLINGSEDSSDCALLFLSALPINPAAPNSNIMVKNSPSAISVTKDMLQPAPLSASLPDLPPNTPFKIRYTSGKGYGIFATIPIARGTCVLAEEPLVRIDQTHYMAKDVELAFDRLPEAEKLIYWTLASAHGQDASRSVTLKKFRDVLAETLKAR